MSIPIGLNIDNPQTQDPLALVSPSVVIGGATYGGNAVGSGASTATSGSPTPTATIGGFSISTILIYGVIALVVIFLLQRLDHSK
jgi:hypothetical protein